MKKIRLNDEQWKKLQGLPQTPILDHGEMLDAPRSSSRLSSHGLIATDHTGREYITDQGVQRLNQGR